MTIVHLRPQVEPIVKREVVRIACSRRVSQLCKSFINRALGITILRLDSILDSARYWIVDTENRSLDKLDLASPGALHAVSVGMMLSFCLAVFRIGVICVRRPAGEAANSLRIVLLEPMITSPVSLWRVCSNRSRRLTFSEAVHWGWSIIAVRIVLGMLVVRLLISFDRCSQVAEQVLISIIAVWRRGDLVQREEFGENCDCASPAPRQYVWWE